MPYRRVQWGWTWLVYLVFAVPFVVFSVTVAAAEDEAGGVVALMVAFMLALLVILVVFSRLEVKSDTETVVTSFGFGWPSHTIEIADVSGVRAVRNRWYYGWGVRRLQTGWMHNVWGLDAVEVVLEDGSTFRIGTDDPKGLEAALALSVRS